MCPVNQETRPGPQPDGIDSTERRATVERALMDRYRARADRPPDEKPRRLLQHAIALALALALVLTVLVGFDKFLTSMQKFMEIEIEERVPPATPAQGAATEQAMPAFVVPSDVSPPPPAGPDPRPNPPQAPDSAPATP
jgi:hypothetical protein